MTDTSPKSESAYVLGHADAELQRLAEPQRAGLPAPRMIGACRVEGGADSYAYRYMATTMRSLLPMFERLGVATAAEVDADTLESRMRTEAVEGTCRLVLPTLVAAWSRTPS